MELEPFTHLHIPKLNFFLQIFVMEFQLTLIKEAMATEQAIMNEPPAKSADCKETATVGTAEDEIREPSHIAWSN